MTDGSGFEIGGEAWQNDDVSDVVLTRSARSSE